MRYQGREICFAYGETAVSIGDVTDEGRPVILGSANMPSYGLHPSGMAHRGPAVHLRERRTGRDERAHGSHPDPHLGRVRPGGPRCTPASTCGETSATDHNLYIVGDMMYQSNYAAGLRVIDISDPLNAREVGYFDTAPFAPPVPGFFDGSWSNYPFFPSGNILVTEPQAGAVHPEAEARPSV